MRTCGCEDEIRSDADYRFLGVKTSEAVASGMYIYILRAPLVAAIDGS